MIIARNLSAGYFENAVLKDLNFSAECGKITVVVGPNGCGKSTLLKVMAGIHPYTAGEIFIDGKDIKELTARERACQIAYLAQSKPIPDITVLRMVLHGRFPYLAYPRKYRKEDMMIARRAIQQMGIEKLENCPMQTLSGGTRQKVYIAMALAQDTPLIFMDEPTTYLDAAYQLQTMEQAAALAAAGKAVVMVLHDLPLALRTADCIAVMQEGRIVKCGDPQSVFEDGCLDRVFGIRVKRVCIDQHWQYYYESESAYRSNGYMHEDEQ